MHKIPILDSGPRPDVRHLLAFALVCAVVVMVGFFNIAVAGPEVGSGRSAVGSPDPSKNSRGGSQYSRGWDGPGGKTARQDRTGSRPHGNSAIGRAGRGSCAGCN